MRVTAYKLFCKLVCLYGVVGLIMKNALTLMAMIYATAEHNTSPLEKQ